LRERSPDFERDEKQPLLDPAQRDDAAPEEGIDPPGSAESLGVVGVARPPEAARESGLGGNGAVDDVETTPTSGGADDERSIALAALPPTSESGR
jgi:hypothetical protein